MSFSHAILNRCYFKPLQFIWSRGPSSVHNTIRLRPLILSSHKGSGSAIVVICIVIFRGNFLAPAEPECRSGWAVQFCYLLWHVIALVVPYIDTASCRKGTPQKSNGFRMELVELEVQLADTVFLMLIMYSSCFSLCSTLCTVRIQLSPLATKSTKMIWSHQQKRILRSTYQEGTLHCCGYGTFSAGKKTILITYRRIQNHVKICLNKGCVVW